MLRQYLSLPRSIHILCLGSFINRAGAFVVVFLVLYLRQDLGLDVTFATKTMGVFGLGAIVAALVGGHLADQIGRRTVMLFSLFGGAAILLVFSFVTARWAIMPMVLLFAMVVEMYRPAASAMIADLTDPIQRPHAFGLMYVAINLGFAVGAFVGGKVAAYGFQYLFWGDALTTVIYGLIIVLAISETLPDRTTRKHRVIEPAPVSASVKEPPLGPVSLRDAAANIVTNYPFMVFCLATFLVSLVFMQSISTFPLYLEAREFAADDYGTIIALNGLLIVFLQLPLTALLSRHHRGKVVAAGAMTLALGFGLTGLCATTWHFALAVAVWTCGEMMMAPFHQAIVSDLAPIQLRARYMGVFSMSFSLGGMLGPPIGGEILGHPRLGGLWLWSGTFAVGMTAAVLFFTVRRQIAEKRD